jgi:NADH:ubiquinone oxidoreductase subunit 6 (subunit J)
VTHPVVLAVGAAAATQSIAFWALAIGSVAAALGIVLARKAVHCAVLLALVMLTLAIMYAMQGAPFLAFVQVIVYTGAVLMLFLFVVMIVGVTSADSVIETIKGQRLAAGVAGIALLVLLSLIVGQAVIGPAAPGGPNFGSANVGAIATLIFTRYVFPFEVTSALLITAARWCSRTGSAPARSPASGTCPSAAWPASGPRRSPALALMRGTTPWTCRPCCPTAPRPGCR